MKKSVFILLCMMICSWGYAQKTINNYKYVVVPKRFEFLRKDNQYQLNVLTKFLMEKQNFTVLYTGDNFPPDFAQNNCLGLKTKVVNNSNVFTTKLHVELVDCFGNTVFKSDEGRSKQKDFKKGYHEAIRSAFKSFGKLKYKYEPYEEKVTQQVVTQTVDNQKATNQISEKTDVVVQETVKTIEKTDVVVQETIKKGEEKLKTAVEEKTVSGLKNEKSIQSSTSLANRSTTEKLLYAQAIDNGFQLVDQNPKIVFVIQKTSLPDVFLLKNKKGTFFKKGDFWIAEYYNEDNELIQEQLKVKF